MSKAFDIANIHKLTLTNIPNIIKFIANYIKGQQACTQYNSTLSKLKQINTGLQGGVFSPTLFNIYTSEIPLPPEDVRITTYADDITITASHTKQYEA